LQLKGLRGQREQVAGQFRFLSNIEAEKRWAMAAKVYDYSGAVPNVLDSLLAFAA